LEFKIHAIYHGLILTDYLTNMVHFSLVTSDSFYCA